MLLNLASVHFPCPRSGLPVLPAIFLVLGPTAAALSGDTNTQDTSQPTRTIL